MKLKITLSFLTAVLINQYAFLVEHSIAEDKRPLVSMGVILPLSGGMSDAGTAFNDGIRLAEKDIPADSKCQYKVIVEDDQLQPAKASSAAKKLIEIDGVQAIFSTWSYGGAVVAPIAEKALIPHIAVAWDVSITKNRTFSFLHISPPRTFIPMYLDVFEKKHQKNIAIFGMTESGSIFTLDTFEKLSKERKINVVMREVFNFGTIDFKSALLRVKQKNPDAIFINSAMPEIQTFLKQVKDLGITIPVTAMTGFEVLEDASLAEGKWYVSDSTPSAKFSERLLSEFHQTRSYGVGNYYDMVHLVVDASEKICAAGRAPTGKEILLGLQDVSKFNSIFGALTLGEDHVYSYPSVYRMIKDGKRTTITEENIP